jgi:NADPH2:quinone reductase
MKAVALTRYLPIDHPESLLDVDLETPVATGHDLLIEVKAISVNPVDHKVRAPKDRIEPAAKVLGWDVAGAVKAVGAGVTLFKVGDPVYYAGSITRPGCNSEFHLVDERIVGRMPKSLGFAQAAALPLTTLTAWESLFHRLGVAKDGAEAGKVVLIIGGAGGVGSIAIQLAKQLAKLRVIATASRAPSAQWARQLGADDIIDHTQPLAEQLARIGVAEVDYILCFNAVDQHFAAFAGIIKPQGKICIIVGTDSLLPLGSLMSKSVTVAWELMFTRAMFNTPDMIAQHHLLNEAADLVDRGILKTTLAENFGPINAANLKRAHKSLEQGHAIGKIVLEGFTPA